MNMPNDDRLIRALHASRDARLTGALRIETDCAGGTIFFDSGHVYFAVIDGDKPRTESFEKDGITREMLEEASKAPRSNDRFADALMSVGVPGQAVREFGRRTIIEALTKCLGMGEARFTADDRQHPYGPAFTFEVNDLLEAIGAMPTHEPAHQAAAPAPVPTQPSYEAETGIGFRRRTGLKAAALAAQSR